MTELNLGNLKYTKEHEWLKQEGEFITIGITDYAQDSLGDIVYFDAPEADSIFDANEAFATLESTKAASEVYMPIKGKIIKINTEINDNPQFINSDPYNKGWLVQIKADNPLDLDSLLTYTQYQELLEK